MAAQQPDRIDESQPAHERREAFLATCADETRFGTWYRAALPRVYGFVNGRTGGDAATAEDVTQQVFIAAVRNRATFDGRSDPVVWICAMAKNALVDLHRRKAREARRHLSLVVREISVDGDARAWQRLDERDELLEALRGLTPDQRTAIFLRYVDELPIRDIAHAIARSESATESLLSRARERLRTVLGGGGSMTEDRIRRALATAAEPTEPDPAFADALYGTLQAELGLRPPNAPAARAGRRGRLLRFRLPRRLLLVAVLALGGGAAVLASGGAWRSQLDATGRMEPPDVCALVSPDEISAIEGAPVRLKQPLTRTQGAEWVTFWCGYDYLAPAPPGPETREVHLQITAYADRAAAAAFLRSASGSYGHIGGLGEGATVLQPTAASSSLVVLVGNWILQIAGDRTGTYLDMPRVRQIAELLLQRL